MNLLSVVIINRLLFDLLLVLLSIARLYFGLLTLNRSLTLYFLRRLGALLFRKWWVLIWSRLISRTFARSLRLRLIFWTVWTLILFFANTCFLAFLFLWKLFRTIYLSIWRWRGRKSHFLLHILSSVESTTPSTPLASPPPSATVSLLLLILLPLLWGISSIIVWLRIISFISWIRLSLIPILFLSLPIVSYLLLIWSSLILGILLILLIILFSIVILIIPILLISRCSLLFLSWLLILSLRSRRKSWR